MTVKVIKRGNYAMSDIIMYIMHNANGMNECTIPNIYSCI